MNLAARFGDALMKGQVAWERFIRQQKAKGNEDKTAVEVVINDGWCFRCDPLPRLQDIVRRFFNIHKSAHSVCVSPDKRTFVIKGLTPVAACALASYIDRELPFRDPLPVRHPSMRISIQLAEVTLLFSRVWC